ncbi:MAG: preprotein translocase subunit YajC [Clostridiales bacterium]|nr:preprotein translocase subunit YajC [Clostridiales bacterium]
MSPVGGIIGMLLPIVAMIAVFYFLIIRPERKKSKKVKEMLDSLKVGDRICTIGGIYGTITGLREDSIELAVGKQDAHMVVARWAIRNVEEITVENDSELLV